MKMLLLIVLVFSYLYGYSQIKETIRAKGEMEHVNLNSRQTVVTKSTTQNSGGKSTNPVYIDVNGGSGGYNRSNNNATKSSSSERASNTSLYNQLNRKGKDFALIFVNSEFENATVWQTLPKSKTQTERIEIELKEKYGFETKLYKNFTKSQIEQKLQEYKNKPEIKVGDAQLLVYFVSHGIVRKGDNLTYLVTKDSEIDSENGKTFIPLYTLVNMVSELPCKHILMVVDACYSSEPCNVMAGDNDKEPPVSVPSQIDNTTAQDYTSRWISKSRKYLGAATSEVPDGTFGSKFFNILSAFNSKEKGLTYDEIKASLLPMANKIAECELSGDEMRGDFIFIPKK